jgi:cyclic-di-AMP phosphodiesterase PgpH
MKILEKIMAPLFKKTLFRIRKLQRPLASEQNRKKEFFAKSSLRMLTVVSTVVIVVAVVFSSRLPVSFLINEGDISSEDIYAPFDFSYTSGVDEKQTKLAQDEAERAVYETYSLNDNVLNSALKRLDDFFILVKELKDTSIDDEASRAVLLERIKEASGIHLKDNEIILLLEIDDIERVKSYSEEALKAAYSQPVISRDDKNRLSVSGKDRISIYDISNKEKKDADILDMHAKEAAAGEMEKTLSSYDIADKKVKALLSRMLSAWILPNLEFNKDETDISRRQARSSVEPSYITEERLKGEVIIRKGQRITRAHVTQLDAVSSQTAPGDTFSQLLGIALIVCLLLFAMFVFIKIFEFKIYSQEKLFALICIFVILTALSSRAIAVSPLPSLFLPLAAVPMLLTLLIGGHVAAITLVIISVIAALVAGIKFNVFLVGLIGGITAICAVYNARSRSRIIRAGFYVGIMNFVVISTIGVISNFEIHVFLRQALWGMASGITSSAIAMIFLPLFESIFKITTDIRLLELADLNHPLLKDMVTRATGTYHHSIIVGNLAEAAAEAIGANALLCRIGAYYHDIGKIEKAEYFAENEQVPSESHKGLSPSMSSLVITNHVKDGEELAEKYKLGPAIKDIIKQHHGTSIITYFYHQAIEKKKQHQVVTDASFRYSGPKPQSKESAIVMFADSVEAASRLIQEPTPQKLKELVRKIINNKFMDRQLDECDLTLKDISRISESFVKILTGTYHSRVKYPDIKKTNNGNTAGK